MKKLFWLLLTLLSFNSWAATVNIVAAENFYGELSKEIGGKYVNVQSILSNPDADPHLFTTSPATSKSLQNANIIIYSGAAYDPWIDQMLSIIDTKGLKIINVGDLVGVKIGENPHVWYKPDAFPKMATELTLELDKRMPEQSKFFNKNLQDFLKNHNDFMKKVNLVKSKYQGTSVTATEPVFGYMAQSLGLNMLGLDFQWKVMNNTEPSPTMVANYEKLINNKTVKVLFYNSQVSDSVTKNMKALAQKNSIPIVGVTETMPNNISIMVWLNQELNDTEKALSSKIN